jgi:putative endonuclease
LVQLDKKWFLYVVECSDGTLYTGITKDLNRRINEHNYGIKAAKYTRSRRPVKLLISWEYKTHSEAASEEYHFKKLNRKQKLEVING